MINSGDYVYIVNDKKLKGSGLDRGDVVYVTGTKVAPVSAKDPYLQRVYIHCIFVKHNGEHLVPKEDNDHVLYLIDPRNVEPLDEEGTEFYRQKLKEQYGHE